MVNTNEIKKTQMLSNKNLAIVSLGKKLICVAIWKQNPQKYNELIHSNTPKCNTVVDMNTAIGTYWQNMKETLGAASYIYAYAHTNMHTHKARERQVTDIKMLIKNIW